MIGQTISHYKILEKLGEGGMGEVYLAEDTKLDRNVALKFLPRGFTRNKDARDRFKREAKAAAALNHPNIVTIHEINEHEDQTYIAMEYVEGQTLKDKIAARPLPIAEIVDIAIQICEGLAAAHAKGIVHRDIKPQNIIVDKKGRIKILDFGLAKLRGISPLTREASTLGTIHYMSPEQVKAQEVDQRSDIFSFGVVLYEMLTGQQPFTGEYQAAVIYAIINETQPPAARFNPHISNDLERIVSKALVKDREERYQHADDLLADLRHERKTLEYITAGQASKAMAAFRPKKKKWMIAAIATAIVTIFVLLFLLFSPIKLRIGPQEKAHTQENSLAVMYFENLQDPEDKNKTAQMLTALLTTGLSDSPRYMQVVSSQRLFDILNLLGKGDLRIIDKTVASEVARKANVQWMVTGKLLKEEPDIILISEISDATTGKILATQRVYGAAGENLFAVVDKLSPQVVKALSLPEQAQKELERPISEVTTRSQDAYRCYMEGVGNYDKVYINEAIKDFENALDYDPGFAGAYVRLAIIHLDREEIRQAKERISQAMKFSSGMTQKEKLIAESIAGLIAGSYNNKTIETFKEIIHLYPDDKEAYSWLGNIYYNLHNNEEGIQLLNKAIDIDPLYRPAYNMLAYAYNRIGDSEKSLWAINKYISLAPGEANAYDTRGELYMFNGRTDAAIESFQKALAVKPDFWGSLYKIGILRMFKKEFFEAQRIFKELIASKDPIYRFRGRTALATIPAYRGKFKEASAVLSEIIAVNEREHYAGPERGYNHLNKARIHEERYELDLAIAETMKALEYSKESDPDSRFWFRDYHIYLLMQKGKTFEAETLAQQLKTDSESYWPLRFAYWRAEGVLALARNDLKKAQNYFEQDKSKWIWTTILLARIYLQQGILDKAVEILEKALIHNYCTYDDSFYYPVLVVKAHYLLGQAYERSGWNDKAIQKYEEFLDIWKEADSGLSEVADARKRLEKLKKS